MTPSKKTQKEAFQKKHGLTVDGKTPLFVVIEDLSGPHADLFFRLMEGLLETGMQVAVMEPGDRKAADALAVIAKNSSAHVTVIARNEAEKKKLYNVADITLLFGSSPDMVKAAWKAKSVPVTYLHKVVTDYHPISETGNGFIYHQDSLWSLFAACVRAYETYKFPYDWNTIVMNGVR